MTRGRRGNVTFKFAPHVGGAWHEKGKGPGKSPPFSLPFSGAGAMRCACCPPTAPRMLQVPFGWGACGFSAPRRPLNFGRLFVPHVPPTCGLPRGGTSPGLSCMQLVCNPYSGRMGTGVYFLYPPQHGHINIHHSDRHVVRAGERETRTQRDQ